MPPETKNKYKAEAKDLQEKYNIEIKKWEEGMIQAGHNFIRSSVKTSDSTKHKPKTHKREK